MGETARAIGDASEVGRCRWLQQFFKANIVFLQEFFDGLFQERAIEPFGFLGHRIVVGTKGQRRITNFTEDGRGIGAEFVFLAEGFCDGERVKAFEKRTGERVVGADGGGR